MALPVSKPVLIAAGVGLAIAAVGGWYVFAPRAETPVAQTTLSHADPDAPPIKFTPVEFVPKPAAPKPPPAPEKWEPVVVGEKSSEPAPTVESSAVSALTTSAEPNAEAPAAKKSMDDDPYKVPDHGPFLKKAVPPPPPPRQAQKKPVTPTPAATPAPKPAEMKPMVVTAPEKKPVVPPAPPPTKANALADLVGPKRTVYEMYDGTRITAVKTVDMGEMLGLKDASGIVKTVRKSDIKRTIKP